MSRRGSPIDGHFEIALNEMGEIEGCVCFVVVRVEVVEVDVAAVD